MRSGTVMEERGAQSEVRRIVGLVQSFPLLSGSMGANMWPLVPARPP